MLHLTLFGHFRATLQGKPLPFPTKSAIALVAYLLLERARPQPRARLATLLWPDSLESKGRRNLRQTLLRLRRTLPDIEGQPAILALHDALQWNPAYPADVDAHHFEAAMARAEPFLRHTPLTETPYPAIAPLRTAAEIGAAELLLGLDLLNDFYAEWLAGWRTTYRRQALMALARLAESFARAGQLRRMETMAQRQLALDPDREIAHRQLMQAHLAQEEYGAAIRHYAVYQRQLGEYGLQPAPALQGLRDQASAWRQGRAAPPPPIPHNLPPEATPFYGRQQALDDLLRWLVSPDQRLLTLTGLGGMGKTRLAQAAARHFTHAHPTIPPRFPGGVWFISLADLEEDDEDAIARTILQNCDLQAQPDETAIKAVIRHARGEARLFILDNLEHLQAAPRLILTLLKAIPNLTLLATSRQPLGLQREVARQLGGLPIPKDENDANVPSVTLLIERMQRANSEFQPTPDAMPALIRISQILDGWPLALELAASWADRLPVGEIASRVADNITALITTHPDLPPRQRSIEAALTGSYALLTPSQQQILARFAVFRGGCTREAAQAVLQAGIVDMTLLVRRTLLKQRRGRYVIHELIRQFARRQLESSGEREAAEEAQAEYYLHLLISLESELYGLHPLDAIHQLRPERENLHKAWRWAAAHGRGDLLASALPACIRFYNLTGFLREGETLLRQTRAVMAHTPLARDLLLAHARFLHRLGDYEAVRDLLTSLSPAENMPPPQRMEAHLLWGALTLIQGFIPESEYHYQQALALARRLGHQEGMVVSLTQLGTLTNYEQSIVAEVTALSNEVRDIWLRRRIHIFFGAASIHHSRYRQACDHWQKAMAISLELEDSYAVATLHNNLGDALRELGDFAAAEDAFQQAMDLAEALHHEPVRRCVLEGWARLCVLRQAYDQAIPLAEEAISLSAASGDPVGEMAALACLGHAYVGLGRWRQAEKVYARAAAMMPEIPHLALESVAGLAYVRWRLGDEAAARAHIQRFLDLLAGGNFIGFTSPGLSYGRVAEVLQALGDSQQAKALCAMETRGV